MREGIGYEENCCIGYRAESKGSHAFSHVIMTNLTITWSSGSITAIEKVEGTLKEAEESVGNEGEYRSAAKDEEDYKATQTRPTLHPRVCGDLGNPTIWISISIHQRVKETRATRTHRGYQSRFHASHRKGPT